MAKRKFYAVKVGKLPGIYQTWSQAEEQVKGFPGAEYKSFLTLEEAERYISPKPDDVIGEENGVDDINKEIQIEIDNLESGQVIAFVDAAILLMLMGKQNMALGRY